MRRPEQGPCRSSRRRAGADSTKVESALEGERPFKEPWEAQAFALAVKLEAEGHFTWADWSETLGAEIKAAQARGDPDDGSTYYRHWLAALRRLVAEKGLAQDPEIEARKSAWREAHERTPHGEPVALD